MAARLPVISRPPQHADAGLTFPTWDPQVRLDYVFLPKSLAPRLTQCQVVTEGPVTT